MINTSTNAPAISLDRVTVRYHHTHKSAIKNITANIPSHTITALVGPNGSGKSTLIKAIVGLINFQGKITFAENNNFHQKIGYVPQRHHINTNVPISVTELLQTAHPNLRNQISHSRIKNSLKMVGALKLQKTPLNQLSGGQLQRVLLARGIVANPQILILDEPEAGIDSKGEINFYELLKKMKETIGLTILLASHEIDMIYHYADYVICINKQLIAKGLPSKVLSHDILHDLHQHS